MGDWGGDLAGRSNLQFLVTSGMPIAIRPQPSNGTFFNCALAK